MKKTTAFLNFPKESKHEYNWKSFTDVVYPQLFHLIMLLNGQLHLLVNWLNTNFVFSDFYGNDARGKLNKSWWRQTHFCPFWCLEATQDILVLLQWLFSVPLPTHGNTHTRANVMRSMSIRSQPLYHTACMRFLLAALYSYTLKSPTALGWGLCTAGSYSRWPNKWAKAGRHREKKDKKKHTTCSQKLHGCG